jgi:hypothetical protein
MMPQYRTETKVDIPPVNFDEPAEAVLRSVEPPARLVSLLGGPFDAPGRSIFDEPALNRSRWLGRMDPPPVPARQQQPLMRARHRQLRRHRKSKTLPSCADPRNPVCAVAHSHRCGLTRGRPPLHYGGAVRIGGIMRW